MEGAATEDLDFSDLKKKKKSSKKKANLDMEAFERELSESKTKDEEEGDEEGDTNAAAFNDIDETEHGENPFARSDEPVQQGSESEPWLGSDRDYTYPEVSSSTFCDGLISDSPNIAPTALLQPTARRQPNPPCQHRQTLRYCAS